MPRRDFHFAGHALRVEAAEEPLAWLHEFVAPQFAARDTEAPDRTITLIIDAREHARLLGRGRHPQHLRRACFTLDSGIVNGRVGGGTPPRRPKKAGALLLRASPLTCRASSAGSARTPIGTAPRCAL